MLSCADATRKMSEALEHDLTWQARMGLRVHVLMCSACRRYRRQILGIESLIRRRRSSVDAEGARGEVEEMDSMRLSPAKRQEIKRSLRS